MEVWISDKGRIVRASRLLRPFIFWLAVACNVAFVMPFL